MKSSVVILGHIYKEKYGHSIRQVKRMDKGIEVFLEKNVDYIMTTGGVGRTFNNTDTAMSILMADYLKQKGISKGKIRYETKSTNTYENALYLKPIIKKLGIKKLYVVTSWDHILRSKFIFQDTFPGVYIEMVNSDFIAGWWTFFDLVWQIFGLLKYFLLKFITLKRGR